MNKSILKLFFLLCTMTYCTNICRANGIPVVTVPNEDDNLPHRTLTQQDVYAVFDTTTYTLSLFVSPEIEISTVEIYKDGNMIISDDVPTLYYILSSYGNGAYTIQLNAVDGTTYTGDFSY